MKRWVYAVILGFVIGGCTGAEEHSNTTAVEAPDPHVQAEPEERGGDVWCDEFEAGEGGVTDCVLRVNDERFLNFAYSPAEYGHTLVFSLFSFAGETLQVSETVEIGNVYSTPELRDINGDGRDELFVPLMTGNVNTLSAVWQQDDDGWFRPAGELSGYDEIRGSLIVVTSRSNAATYVERAVTLGPDGFAEIYEMEINYAARRCTILHATGLDDLKLSAEQLVADCEVRDWNG
jgi:hypothetical protein